VSRRRFFVNAPTALVSLSAFFHVLAFPSFLHPAWTGWQAVLAWVALVPLFLAFRHAQTIREGWWMGWEFGTVSWIGILYWIGGMTELGPLAVPAWLSLSVALGLYEALFGLGSVYFIRHLPSTICHGVLMPALWVSLEFLRAHLFTGFPWALLGSSQLLNLPLVQWAAGTGIYGLSFLVVMGNGFWMGKKRLLTPFLMVAHVVGFWSLSRVERPVQDQTFSVVLLQGNVPQTEKWDANQAMGTYDRYASLVQSAPRADGYVWPETAAPHFLKLERTPRERVSQIVRESSAWHFIGAPDADVDERGRVVRQANSVFVFSPKGEMAGRYDKCHLVPFGEFTPFHWLKPLVTRYTIGVAEFRRGDGPKVLEAVGVKWGPFICYEAIFPHEVRQSVQAGAEILVNVTNDAWFGKSAAPYQHAQVTAFRAVETGRWLVRAANTGVSYVVSPAGRLVGQSGLEEATVLRADVTPLRHSTWYVRWGDWFPYLCVVSVLVGLAHVFLFVSRRIG